MMKTYFKFLLIVLIFAGGFVLGQSMRPFLQKEAEDKNSALTGSILPDLGSKEDSGSQELPDQRVASKIRVTESGDILVDASLANRLTISPFDGDFNVNKEELALFGLDESQVNNLQELTDTVKDMFSTRESDRLEIVESSNTAVLIRLSGLPKEQAENYRNRYMGQVNTILGESAVPLTPSIENALRNFSASWGADDQYVKVEPGAGNRKYKFTTIHLSPATAGSADGQTFDQLKGASEREFTFLADEIPDRLSHLIEPGTQ